jgi:hypothetical protein
MNIPLMSLEDLNSFWLKPRRTFVNLFINKKQRMVFTKKSATFAIENENNFLDTLYPEKALFYVNMDTEPKENELIFIIDVRNDQFKIIRYGNMFYKIAEDAIIGVIVDILPNGVI